MWLFPMNLPAWSLFFELVVNFVFGLAGKQLNTLILALVIFGASLTLMLAVSFGWLGFGTGYGPMDAGPGWPIGAGLVRVSYSFFAGVLTHRLWKVHGPKIVLPPTIVVVALCAVLAVYPPESYQVGFDLLATLIVFPAIAFLGASSITGTYTSCLFTFLGNLSYGVYVLQVPLYGLMFSVISKVMGQQFGGVSLILGAISITFVAGVAIIVDRYFDRPVRRKLTDFLR